MVHILSYHVLVHAPQHAEQRNALLERSHLWTVQLVLEFLLAQQEYLQSGAHVAPIYSFTLQGDPALKFDWIRYKEIFLPQISGVDQ